MPADIRSDIMDRDYTTYNPKDFDVIWASPPCTEYSMAKTTGVKQIEEANRISQRTIDLIRHFDPQYWVIEKPHTGKLK
jgi:site-specific DNA-cytosine methylase